VRMAASDCPRRCGHDFSNHAQHHESRRERTRLALELSTRTTKRRAAGTARQWERGTRFRLVLTAGA
jgi:hypothetical protein